MANDEEIQSGTAGTVGSRLKKARESKGLTASDVADAQHLRTGVIHSIESAEYEQIGSELFLKGYVRAYAVHVGLNADRVIEDLDRELEPLRQKQAQELEANPLVDIERRRRRKRQIAMILIPVVALAIVGALLFTFVFSGDEPESEVSTPGVETLQEDAAVGESDLNGQADEDISVPETSDKIDASATDSEAEVPAAGGELPADTDAMTTNATLALPAEEGIADENVQVTPPAAEAPLAPSEVQPVSDAGRLQISLVDDCWMRVTDALGNRLVNGLKRSGSQVDVTGEPPLKVIIGAVSAIDSIRFQGLPVEISKFPAINNRSEFTLEN